MSIYSSGRVLETWSVTYSKNLANTHKACNFHNLQFSTALGFRQN